MIRKVNCISHAVDCNGRSSAPESRAVLFRSVNDIDMAHVLVHIRAPGRAAIVALAGACLVMSAACNRSTSRLSADQQARFQAEGIRRKADDVVFRFTRGAGGRNQRWEDRRASIIVTGASILIHKNEKVGLEVTPRTRRAVAVQRAGGRIRLRSGSGGSEEIWSFEPESDAEGWVQDIRATLKGVDSGKR